MGLYDSSAPKSVESFTMNAALAILSKCECVQELLETPGDETAAAALIKQLQDPPQNGEAYTRDELEEMGNWGTLSPPPKEGNYSASPSGASGIRDVEGQLWFRLHRMVPQADYNIAGGRQDVWNFVRDRSAAIVEQFAELGDPVFNDGGIVQFVFERQGLPLYNPMKDFAAQGIYIEANFNLHYGRRGGNE